MEDGELVTIVMSIAIPFIAVEPPLVVDVGMAFQLSFTFLLQSIGDLAYFV